MPLISERQQVLDTLRWMSSRGWVLPAFGVENLTTVEGVLAATVEQGQLLGVEDLPVMVALTNLYPHRSQTVEYTHTRDWRIGLRLFMADLTVLTSPESPYGRLRVLIHLDHIQPDLDHDLLQWDLAPFSSIMFDASSLTLEENIAATARFVAERGKEIVVEGACDEIVDATGQERATLTRPDEVERYFNQTRCDIVVANLGTEHRASRKTLAYHGNLARQMKARIGNRLCLHGTSSVSSNQLGSLFSDGVIKVNVWTALERDSSPRLLREMVKNAARVAGPETTQSLHKAGLLGPAADLVSDAALAHFTTSHRQAIVFEEMKRITREYLTLWYR